MNESINYGGDCRTAPATPGLLNITASHFETTVKASETEIKGKAFLVYEKLLYLQKKLIILLTKPSAYPKINIFINQSFINLTNTDNMTTIKEIIVIIL